MRLLRTATYMALGPIDDLAKAINGRKDYPPLHLRRDVGLLRTFEASGAQFLVYLKLLGELRPEERVLDVGCGCGQLPLQLQDFMRAPGCYVGTDVYLPSVRWCQKHFAHREDMSFIHMDVFNSFYNDRGRCAPEDYSFPFDDGSFEVIVAKSLFTHMAPSGLRRYLEEFRRLLSDNGRCLATFFLLNPEQRNLSVRGLNEIEFPQGEGIWRYAYPGSPEALTAYDERELRAELQNMALAASVLYGTWSGRPGLDYQDLLIMKKGSSNEGNLSVVKDCLAAASQLSAGGTQPIDRGR